MDGVGTQHEGNEELLLMRPLPWSYDELLEIIVLAPPEEDANATSSSARNPSTSKNSATYECRLPVELIKRILSYLTVKRVNHDQVKAIGCSSTEGAFPLEATLDGRNDTWWLSEQGSMPGGRGSEWVEYQLVEDSSAKIPVRLASISITIPSLPSGPLSIRDFSLYGPQIGTNGKETWQPISPQMELDGDIDDWQQFVLGDEGKGLDVTKIRLVCFSNQISASIPEGSFSLPPVYGIVGFFSIRFE